MSTSCPVCQEVFGRSHTSQVHGVIQNSEGGIVYDGTKHPLHPHCLIEWLQSCLPKGPSNQAFDIKCLVCRYPMPMTDEKVVKLAVEALQVSSQSKPDESAPMDIDLASRAKRPGSPVSPSATGTPKKSRVDSASSAMDIAHDGSSSSASSTAASSSASSHAAAPSSASSSRPMSPGLAALYSAFYSYIKPLSNRDFQKAMEMAALIPDAEERDDALEVIYERFKLYCRRSRSLLNDDQAIDRAIETAKKVPDKYRDDCLFSLAYSLAVRKKFERAKSVAQMIEKLDDKIVTLDLIARRMFSEHDPQ